MSDKNERFLAVKERIARCIWFDQNFATDRLRTDGGDKLRVLSPGWWNLEAGPDFRNGCVRLGDKRVVKGDIEVHRLASDWEKHGHQGDPSYNGVILHVCVWNDTGRRTVQTAGGAIVPQLTLEPYLKNGAATFQE